MDIAIVTGRGPEILTNIENLRPLVEDKHVVAFGYRDMDEQRRFGSKEITETDIYSLEFEDIKRLEAGRATSQALKQLLQNEIEGFWIHLDADVLDDSIMPAVDYRLPGGLSFEELSKTLSILLASQKVSGMSVAIFNPTKDQTGSIARAFVDALVKGFEVRN